MLAYLSRYTHRVAISNSRLLRFDDTGVTVRFKDYRRDGADRQQTMTLAADEFIRRFPLHVLPSGFHRIRHYGLLASSARKTSLARARQLLNMAPPPNTDPIDEPTDLRPPCPCCGGHMVIIETFERWGYPENGHSLIAIKASLARTPARLNREIGGDHLYAGRGPSKSSLPNRPHAKPTRKPKARNSSRNWL